MYGPTLSTRWHCFTTVSTSSPAFDSFPVWSLSLSHAGKAQRCASTRNSLPFHVCALSLSLLSALSASLFVSPLCVSTMQVPLAQNKGSCSFFTLYSWTTPFCSSSGGGCQETTMAVPLSSLSVTVTSRGGALGAEGGRQKIKKHTFIHETVFFITACSLSQFPLIKLSCHNLCLRLTLRWKQKSNNQNCNAFIWKRG